MDNKKRFLDVIETNNAISEHATSGKEGKAYISLPTASAKDDFKAIKELGFKIKQSLLEYTDITEVYWPAEALFQKKNGDCFEPLNALQILKESSYCVFVWLSPAANSILVEIGYALALKKRKIIFARNFKELPYLLRDPGVIECVSLYKFDSIKDIEQLKKNNSGRICLYPDPEKSVGPNTWGSI